MTDVPPPPPPPPPPGSAPGDPGPNDPGPNDLGPGDARGGPEPSDARGGPEPSDPRGGPEPSDAYQAYPPPPPSAVYAPYAPWWRRAIAAVLDWLLVAVPVGVLGAVFGLVDVVREVDGDLATVEVSTRMSVLVFAATLIYSGLMDGSARGATVGKMALLIQVRDANTGGPIGFWRALGRRFIFLILFELYFLPGAVNALWPFWDPRRQAGHDKIVKSVVVSAPRLDPRRPSPLPPGDAPLPG
jgi:uncharacterized RDD family membrane protein YckC